MKLCPGKFQPHHRQYLVFALFMLLLLFVSLLSLGHSPAWHGNSELACTPLESYPWEWQGLDPDMGTFPVKIEAVQAKPPNHLVSGPFPLR